MTLRSLAKANNEAVIALTAKCSFKIAYWQKASVASVKKQPAINCLLHPVTLKKVESQISVWLFLQPKPHFQSSSKRDATPSTSSAAKPAPESGDRPLSYAEFVVQSKKNPSAASPREGFSKLPGPEDVVTNPEHSKSALVSSATAKNCAKRTDGESEVVQKSETSLEAGTEQKEETCQKSDPSLGLGPKPVGSGSSIIVSPRQVPNKV